jgi:antitoxin PrlF
MAVLEEFSTITAKGQTTVPKSVRKILGIDLGGRVAFRVEDGRVTLLPVEQVHVDPLVGRFLDFLAKDVAQRSSGVVPLSREFAARLRSLTKGRRVDLSAPIVGPVEL